MTLFSQIGAAFSIRRGEGRMVLLLLVHSFCIGVARIFTLSAGYALFLTEFDAQTLPYVYISVALVTTVSAFLLFRLGRGLSFVGLLAANLVFLLCCLVGFRVLLAWPSMMRAAIGLPIFYDVLWALSNLEFGALAGRLLTIQQGKRLFGLLQTGEGLATMVGGFLVPVLVPLIGTLNLLIVAAVGVGTAVVMLLVIGRLFASWLVVDPQDEPEISGQANPGLLKNRYLLLVFALAGLNILTYYLLDSVFYDRASIQYRDEQFLAGFFGVFYAACEVFNLLSRTLVSGRLLVRYGLSFGLLVQPVLIAIGAIAVTVAGLLPAGPAVLFWLVVLTKFFDTITGEDINKAASMLVYQPLSPNERLRAQALVDVGITPVATGLAGFGLLAFNVVLHLDLVQRFAILLGLLACWAVVAVWVNREYLALLVRSLTRRRLGEGPLPALDETSLVVLRHQINNPRPEVALFVLNALHSQPDASFSRFLESSLAHSAPEVRIDALRRIEQRGLVMALASVERCLARERDPAVCGAALRTLAAVGGGGVTEWILGYLNHTDRQIRLGAMVGLLRSNVESAVAAATQQALALATAPDPADRGLGAAVLGEARQPLHSQLLLNLLRDPEPQVALIALNAARMARYPALWPAVVELLTAPALRDEAMATLIAGGEQALPAIRACLAQSDTTKRVRKRLLRVLGRIGTPQAQELLVEYIIDVDPDLRHQALQALSVSRCQAAVEEAAFVRQLAEAEARQAVWALAALTDIGEDLSMTPVRDALECLFKQRRDRLLLLLSLLYQGPALIQVRKQINSRSVTKQAHAQEIIDILLPQSLKVAVLPLIDSGEPAERLRQLQQFVVEPLVGRGARLAQIIERPPSGCPAWVRACALHALDQSDAPERDVVVLAAQDSDELLVRESARRAIARREQGVRLETGGLLAHGRPTDGNGLEGDSTMLSALEKVLIMKTVAMFATTPENVLFELATLLKEIELTNGATLFEKGDQGDCMYIIVNGRVRVHDDGRLLNELGERDVFGEMAVLDAEPRVASVTAAEDTLLLRLDQASLYELMADHLDVVRGVINTLTRHIRRLVRAGARPDQQSG